MEKFPKHYYYTTIVIVIRYYFLYISFLLFVFLKQINNDSRGLVDAHH